MATFNQQALDTFNDLGTSPIPSGVFGLGLIANGLSHQQLATNLKHQITPVKPTKAVSLGFGAASLLGTWMLIDGDPINAAGFNFAWAALYTIVNGKSSITGLIRGRVAPAALGAIGLGNAAIYGTKFFWPGRLFK